MIDYKFREEQDWLNLAQQYEDLTGEWPSLKLSLSELRETVRIEVASREPVD